ncbi:MAG: cation:proton antiporter family protein [Nitriliruptoraceae bacterium]
MFAQIAVVLVVCVAAGALCVLLRQPLVVGLLAAGIAVGPQVLGVVDSTAEIRLLSEIGIALLLFVVGLKLDVRIVKKLGPVALATGLGQVAFTSLFGFFIARFFGFDMVSAAYVAVALTFSSTIIIVKLLADKRELDTLHGRIALGFLIVQDIVVVLAMIVITAVGDTAADVNLAQQIAGVFGRGALLLVFVLLFGRYAASRVLHLLARSSELLVLGAVMWAVLLGAVSYLLGFSSEVGAFLAGMSLASTIYREPLSSRLSTLRDFLLVFFFIDLGTQFDLAAAVDQLGVAVVFSLFVLVGNPLIVLVIMGAMGYRKKVSFKAGLTVAQISEFSLILVALGVTQGHIGGDVLGLVTAVGLVTITGSTYLIMNSDAIYERIAPLLRVFERKHPKTLVLDDEDVPPAEYIVVGVGRLGRIVCEALINAKYRVLGVDFDPKLARFDTLNLPLMYGDADDPDLPGQLPLDDAKWVIATVRDFETNLHLVGALKRSGFTGQIAVAAQTDLQAGQLRAAGADVTIRPLHAALEPLMAALELRDTHDDNTAT